MLEKAQVHMVPTDKSAVLFFASFSNSYSKVDLANKDGYTDKWVGQDLYFSTDEEIKDGDWYIGDKPFQANKADVSIYRGKKLPKIVATTDPELWGKTPIDGSGHFLNKPLPKIGLDFVEAYVKAQGSIEEVMLEYEEVVNEQRKFILSQNISASSETLASMSKESKIKLRNNGTVIIHPVKEKLYTEQDMQYYMEYCLKNWYVTPQIWITNYKPKP